MDHGSLHPHKGVWQQIGEKKKKKKTDNIHIHLFYTNQM